jgi:hypothetical protein
VPVRYCTVRPQLLFVSALLPVLASGQWALGPQLGASPTFGPYAPNPALGLRAQRALRGSWQLFAEAWCAAPTSGSVSGIRDPRRDLAIGGGPDTTVRFIRSDHSTLPLSLAVGATSRIGGRRRSSARAQRYWCLALAVNHTRHRRTWSSTGVYSGVHDSGDLRWGETSILFSPGIGHRSRVHGHKRYHVELRPGLQRAVGTGRHAEVSGILGLTVGVTWGL